VTDADDAGGLYYKIEWERCRRASSALKGDVVRMAAYPEKRRRWVILSDGGDLAPALASALAAAGDTVGTMDQREWRTEIQSSHPTGEPAWVNGAAADENLGIVYLGALDAARAASESYQVDFEFVKHAARANKGKIWLVTRGAVNVRGVEDVTSPEQAALWGLGRTFAREHPSIWGGLLDLDCKGDTSDAVAAVVETIRADDGEDQIVWRDGSRRAARLLPQCVPDPSRSFSVRPERAYLITGGLGGIGLQVAAWLADHGAQHLVLVGRRPLPLGHKSPQSDDPRLSAVAKLEERGIIVSTAALDVGDPAAMASMISRFGSEWPQLGGIIHAAVALTHSPLINMPSDEFLSMMRTKATGAQLLRALSSSQPIDFIVNFSSGAALLGPVQDAHYAAANAVLDALACSWSAQGIAALSVNWGTWEQMWGLDPEGQRRMARAGFRPMSATVALGALGCLLAAGVTNAVVADMDRPVLRDVYESRGGGPLLQKLFNDIDAEVRREAADGEEVDLAALAPAERRIVIEGIVRRDVAAVLGLTSADTIDAGMSLFKMGLDSLMAIQMQRRLERASGGVMPPALVFNHPTVSALVDLVDQTVAARLGLPGDREDAGELLARVDQLSDEEVEALLGEMLPEGGAT
jgi:NAD(P)-dependent dehydrogenase (short-subunit alcohol dehydrogenase family)/aryl carrier-like protein